MKMHPAMIAAGASALMLAACGTTMEQRAASGGLLGAAAGAAVADDGLTGALIGGAAGAAVGAATTPKEQRRQYYDRNAGRYYFYDETRQRYYWENGEPRR